MLYGMVLYGTIRCCAVRYGIAWYGTVLYGTVRYGVVWCGTVLCGAVRYCMVRYGIVWYGTVMYCVQRRATVRYGTVREAVVVCGTVWYRIVRYGDACDGAVWWIATRSVRTSQGRRHVSMVAGSGFATDHVVVAMMPRWRFGIKMINLRFSVPFLEDFLAPENSFYGHGACCRHVQDFEWKSTQIPVLVPQDFFLARVFHAPGAA